MHVQRQVDLSVRLFTFATSSFVISGVGQFLLPQASKTHAPHPKREADLKAVQGAWANTMQSDSRWYFLDASQQPVGPYTVAEMAGRGLVTVLQPVQVQ